MRRSRVRKAGKYYQVFLGAGKTETADSLARLLIRYSVTGDTYAVLVGHAVLAGRRDEAQKLLEEAARTLPGAALPVVEAAAAHPDQAVAAER